MYLIDTNVLLEFLLDQQKADDVARFLSATAPVDRFLTEFSLYSLGVILVQRRRPEALLRVIDDVITRGRVQIIRLRADEIRDVVRACEQFNLDFDDAYQYAAAEKHDLTLVSFDTDFDRTERGRKEPGQLLS